LTRDETQRQPAVANIGSPIKDGGDA
jgi:hypothetical protein